MKTLPAPVTIIAFLGFALASASAQSQSATSSTTYIETSKLVGTKVKSSQGEEIGTIKDVVLDRNTGCMAYTVLSSGGGGSRDRGGKMVAVPWAVYSPTSNLNELTVTVDRQRIYSAPAFDYAHVEEYSRPDYITNVYSYYGVSPSAAVGVGVSGAATTGATTTTGVSTRATETNATTRSATGATANAGATASPGRAASPTPHATPAETPHRTPVERTRAHGTASPGTHDEERTTPRAKRTRGERRGSNETPSSNRADTESRGDTERSQREHGSQDETENATRGSNSETEQSRSEEPTSSERTTGTRHHEKTGKHNTSTPSESPEE